MGDDPTGGHLLEPDMSANQQTSNKQLKPRLRSRQLQSKLRSSCDACGQAKVCNPLCNASRGAGD